MFSSGSKRADSGQVNDEGRVLLCTGRRMSIFDSLVLKPRTTGFVRLRLYGLRRDEIRSGFQNEIKSAKIELCVICRPRKVSGLSGSVRNWAIFFGKKIRDRTTLDARKRIQVMKVRSIPLTRDFKLSPQPRGNVFNGEFDSGSERTLAAWIRHASRAGFFPVAIQGKVQRRTGA